MATNLRNLQTAWSDINGSRYYGGTDPYQDQYRNPADHIQDRIRREGYAQQEPERIRIRQSIPGEQTDRPIRMEDVIHINAPGTYMIRSILTPRGTNWNMTDSDRTTLDIQLEPIGVHPNQSLTVMQKRLERSEKRIQELEKLLEIKEMAL